MVSLPRSPRELKRVYLERSVPDGGEIGRSHSRFGAMLFLEIAINSFAKFSEDHLREDWSDSVGSPCPFICRVVAYAGISMLGLKHLRSFDGE